MMSRDHSWTDVSGKNSDVLTPSRALFSELVIYNTRQGDYCTCKMVGKSDNGGDDVMQG